MEPLLSRCAPLSAKDIELYPRSNIVQYDSLPDSWKDHVKQVARIYIAAYDLATTTHIRIPWGLETTLRGFLSSQTVIIGFEPILQEVMRSCAPHRRYMIFTVPCPAALETPHWIIAFVL
jgi:hypothetical protein